MNKFSPIIIDHFTNPRNLGREDRATAQAFVGNPVCGDQIFLTARIENSQIKQAKFEARGCAAALATGSLLTLLLHDCTIENIEKITTKDLEQALGGLSPEQCHVAELGVDVIQRLVLSEKTGVLDQGPTND